MNSIRIRFAVAAEKTQLEELQRRASHALEEYRADLLAHPGSIELPAARLEDRRVRIAEIESQIAGFSVLLQPLSGVCELDGLFVEPVRWRTGVGRRLLADAFDRARREGARAIDVTANPHGEAFYAKLGFSRTGPVQTQFGTAVRMRATM